ncbi:MAG TPA: TonB-dependent receptor plug domain-containing protein, partial [Bacteroidia bacterium]
MKKEKLFLMSLAVFLCSKVSVAQDTLSTDSVKKLNEITITATRSDKNIFDVGRSITVIGNRELKNGQFNNLADVLSQQEGISMIGTGQNFGGTQSIFIRGANSNQNVILVDGVRITDPSAPNNAPDLSEFSLTNIDKIEIVRGSHSTLYGSSAIGGVVNILTRKDMSPGFHVDAMAMGGVYGKGALVNGQDLFLNYTGKSGFYIGGEVNNFSSGGQDATVDTVTNPNTYDKRDKDGFSRMDYVLKGGYHHGKVDAYIGYRKTKMITDIDKGAFTDDDNYSLDFNRNLITYGATYKFSDSLTFSLIGGFSDMTRYARNDSSVVDTAGNYDHTYYDATYRGTHSTTELQLNWMRRGFGLVAGGGLYAETMSQDQ